MWVRSEYLNNKCEGYIYILGTSLLAVIQYVTSPSVKQSIYIGKENKQKKKNSHSDLSSGLEYLIYPVYIRSYNDR